MKGAETKLWENGKDGGWNGGERWQPEEVSGAGGSVSPEGQVRRRETISGGGKGGQLRGAARG